MQAYQIYKAYFPGRVEENTNKACTKFDSRKKKPITIYTHR